MTQTYRVRYSLKPQGGQCRAADVETLDTLGDLDLVPGQLPPGAYILSIEDLTGGRDVHWTRWPAAYRPGFGEARHRTAAVPPVAHTEPGGIR